MSRTELWFFRDLGLTERLPQEVIDELRAAGQIERWGHRAELHLTRSADQVYLLLKGRIFLRDGMREDPARLKGGDLFGGFVDVESRGPVGQAMDDSMLVALERGIFDEILGQRSGQLSARQRLGGSTQLQVPLRPMLYTTPARRMAKSILHLADEHGQKTEGGGVELPFALRSRTLSKLLGLDRGRTSTTLADLERAGLLRRQRRRAEITDAEALESFSLGLR